MTTMRERIAIVCWNHFGGPEPWGSKLQSESSRRDWLEGADAVLAAIEEPDDVMIKAAEALPVSKQIDGMIALAFARGVRLSEEHDPPNEPLRQWWRAMVRVARETKEQT